MEYYSELAKGLGRRKQDKDSLSRLKIKLCKKHGLKQIPTDIEVYLSLPVDAAKKFKRVLQTKPTRSMSGVAVCAIMSYPFRCPHGQCLMCPGKDGVPQSYTGKEPAAMRGIRNRFDSYLQVMNRLEQYICSGHVPEKIELIIMGGTFPSFDIKYQDDFVMYAFKAMNDFSNHFYKAGSGNIDLLRFKSFFQLPGEVGDPSRTASIHEKLLTMKGVSTLLKEQKKNEASRIRCVGLTIETRPDYAQENHAIQMLKLGCTRVELGVQSLDDEILKQIERGHDVSESVKATRTLKDLGFKVNYHMMPGLPGSSIAKDSKMLIKLFDDDRFRPDMLKVYPCMVVPGSKLHTEWEAGRFSPMSTEDAVSLIAGWKPSVPEYCRIMRVQRDIPSNAVSAGVDRTNLRQIIQSHMKEKGLSCRCIRCREVGRNASRAAPKLKTIGYPASGGTEFFISYETEKALFGFCRLRLRGQALTKEFNKVTAIIRELHVYGEAAEIGKSGVVQHKGLGKKLVKEAERIASANRSERMLVISGVGARDYYRKLGYRRLGQYMAKGLSIAK